MRPHATSTSTAVAATAVLVVAVTLFRRHRRRRLVDRTADEFEAHLRGIHASSRQGRGPCILDARPENVYHFAIGSYELVTLDLERMGGSADAITESLAGSGVREIFEVRRELVHFKKACLLLLQEVLSIERGMIRQTTFFYRELKRCGIEGHACAACSAWRAGRQQELDSCKRARRGSRADSMCTSLPTISKCDEAYPEDSAREGEAYLAVSAWLHSLKGLRVALQDARGLLKAICMVPRHVSSDDDLSPALRDVCEALTATSLVERASGDALAAHSACTEDRSAGACNVDDAALEGRAVLGLRSHVMLSALDAPLACLPQSLPRHVIAYVRQSLFARGLPKATAQAEGAALLASAWRHLQARTQHTLESLLACPSLPLPPLNMEGEGTTSHVEAPSGGPQPVEPAADLFRANEDSCLVDALRHEMKLGRHARILATLRGATEPLLATLEHVLSRQARRSDGDGGDGGGCARKPAEHLFVAGDAARGESATWIPPPLAPLVTLLRRHQDAHDAFEAQMRAAMATEGWPPPATARRTRINEGGVLPCRVCLRHFSRLWQQRGVCWRCEAGLREAGCCPFGAPTVRTAGALASSKGAGKRRKAKASAVSNHKAVGGAPVHTTSKGDEDGTEFEMKGGGECAEECQAEGEVTEAQAKATEAAHAKAVAGAAAAHPFCPHQQRCVSCDSGFTSCMRCRLSQGDGEAVLAAIRAWQPTRLFLDFDLTLCSTKGGANPLKGAHRLDPELHAAVMEVGDDATHVVTRNRHTAEIQTFLEAHGVSVAQVHTTPSGASKWDAISHVLAGSDQRAVFVDDTAREVGDPKMVADERIFRVCFQPW